MIGELLATGVGAVLITLFGIIAGLFLMGIDRICAARMQMRQGPPLTQPFTDIRKLLCKDSVVPCKCNPVTFQCSPHRCICISGDGALLPSPGQHSPGRDTPADNWRVWRSHPDHVSVDCSRPCHGCRWICIRISVCKCWCPA